jgi:hypothetical protein
MPKSDRASIKAGAAFAQTAIDKLATRKSQFKAGQGSPGAVLFEGDSWFNYPADDIPFILEVDYGYHVETVAKRGDTLKSIAFDPSQISDFIKKLTRMKAAGQAPKGVLLSAGGNDVAGREFGGFLNHVNSGNPILNDAVFATFLDERMRPAYISWLTSINEICKQVLGNKVPIIIHGYDFAVPDGRGYNLGVTISGPWMKPGFEANGWTDRQANKKVVQTMITGVNDVLAGLHLIAGLDNIRHLDLRGSLPNGADYKKWWANELHPTDEGFAIVAAKFHAVLQSL